ncbi:MAG: ribosome biogenesis GTPase YlqF, partial [Clostridia bacterium]|nr:ribosome biogenesis GTPase YlqF [Clostridia bacterium]
MDIQWFPGHMAKTRRLVQDNLKLVDVVLELLDARIPLSSRNPLLQELARNKKKLVILNKADLAEEKITRQWEKYFNQQGIACLAVDSLKGNGIKKVPEL